jgi:diaminohydroxyphosphoribosylaminopyrimidine deaminase/5-amino-6-(5-phosphoribosylamino)uracil reductase
MIEAIWLAKQAMGRTRPNPVVGCVIVNVIDGKEIVVGKGFHHRSGQPHAEVLALIEAGELANGATAYVSLEPCNHYGRTPPCTMALLRYSKYF